MALDWGQEEKGTTEHEMTGWYHWLDGRDSEWTPGVGDGQGGLACCNSWDHKESDTTELLNWTELRGHESWGMYSINIFFWVMCVAKNQDPLFIGRRQECLSCVPSERTWFQKKYQTAHSGNICYLPLFMFLLFSWLFITCLPCAHVAILIQDFFMTELY